jgi:hypothetical protein
MEPYGDLESADVEALRLAKRKLEQPTLAAKIAGLAGMPFERSTRLLPERVRTLIADVTNKAVSRALQLSLKSLSAQPPLSSRLNWNKLAGALFGAGGGMLGLPALAVELPASTVVILRAIAETARGYGEDVLDPEAQLACLQVFALGGFSRADDSADTGYYATRAALSGALAEALQFVSRHGVSSEGAPALVRLVAAVAARFGAVVSDKLALTALPLIGALGGATVNVLFIDHFQRVAEGHFEMRRLERKYGAQKIKAAFDAVEVGP